MTTIDNLDIGVYINYARRMQMLEQINKQYHLEEAALVPPQTEVVNLYPKLNELDLLLGVARTYAPWALFLPPKKFQLRRRSPFSFSRVAPIFGEDDQFEEYYELLQSQAAMTRKEENEKRVLMQCFRQMEEINDWLGEIIGKIGQFLQG